MSRYQPLISQAEFDQSKAELVARLRQWYDLLPAPIPRSSSATAGALEGLPDIDSKEVVRANHIFREILGVKLDPKLIKRGGYSSFDDLTGHLLPRIRNTCPTSAHQPSDSISEPKHVN